MGINLRMQEKISLCSIGCTIYHHNIYVILHGFLAQFLHEYYIYRWFSGTVSWFITHLIQECQSKTGVYTNSCSFLDLHLYVDLSVNESTVNLFQMPSTIMNLQMEKLCAASSEIWSLDIMSTAMSHLGSVQLFQQVFVMNFLNKNPY